MPARILTLLADSVLLPIFVLVVGLWPAATQARSLVARADRVSTPVAVLADVEVRLAWPAGADAGDLRIRVARAEAADLGYRFRDLAWRCPLERDGAGGWTCEGEVRQAGGPPMRLALALPRGAVEASLSERGGGRIAMRHADAAPDLFAIDLARVPVAWAQALAARAWSGMHLGDGRLDGSLRVRVPEAAPLRVEARLALDDGGFDTPDGRIAAAGVDAVLDVDWLSRPDGGPVVAVQGDLRGGELLLGDGYFVLPDHPLPLHVRAQGGEGRWAVTEFSARDPGVLDARGSAVLDERGLRELALSLHSEDVAPLPERYLSGWLGLAGLGGLAMSGAIGLDVAIREGRLAAVDLRPRALHIAAPAGRFRFDGLDGRVRLVSGGPVESELRGEGGAIGAIPFGAARFAWQSSGGELRLRAPATIPMLDGRLEVDGLRLRPAGAAGPLLVEGALSVEGLDLARLSEALGLPAFPGTLSGRIPGLRYAGERLDFEGGLSVHAFDGEVRVTSLAMERPFGVAPTLLADIALDGLDLQALTGVFDVGSISGRLHGRIDGLRLVDWEPVAFDAAFETRRQPGVRQRISQRAVQDISSVGDATFTASLQGRLLAFFDDFGYRRIGIACRLANGVCLMGGLQPRGDGFVIVEGAGLPRLDIVGYNRRVDWETLVERVVAAGSGDIAPVFD